MDAPEPSAANFLVDRTGDHPSVVAVGELDVANVHLFGAAIDEALDGADYVAVDLAAVTFADSTALGALVGAHERAVAAGAVLCVSAVSDIVDALFHIAGLSDELRC